MISLILYISILRGREALQKAQSLAKLIYILGFSLACLCAAVPILLDAYHFTSYACQISESDSSKRAQTIIIQTALFYMPLVFSIICSFYCLIKTMTFINEQRSSASSIDFQIEIVHQFCANMTLYPIILTICWFMFFLLYIINILQEWKANGNNSKNTNLTVAQYSICELQGFFNSLAYFYFYFKMKRMLREQEKSKQMPLIKSTITYNSILSLSE